MPTGMMKLIKQSDIFLYYGKKCFYRYYIVREFPALYCRAKFTEGFRTDGLFEQTSKNFALTIDAKRWHSKPPAT